ncbi:hypothetical protein Tco_0553855 [Tanacetum coccineum]
MIEILTSSLGEDCWDLKDFKDSYYCLVIKNGNKVLRRTVGTVEQEYEPTNAKEKQDIRNEMKARATLLMALPNKDHLKFCDNPSFNIHI